MLMSWLAVGGGLALLVAGGEALVRGACGIALLARISPAVVGLTIVAAGTSSPELIVSVHAGLQGLPSLAAGNVVGSNIFNIAAILGIAALVRPLAIQGNSVRMEWPVMMLSACLMHLLARDGSLDRLEGGFFLMAMGAFLAGTIHAARRSLSAPEAAQLGEVTTATFGAVGARAWIHNAAAVIAGLILLGLGSQLLVHGAVALARGLGVSETVIGLTIVAAGTSMPELATSVVASWRGRDDIAVTNILGSNIFNVLGILGLTALVRPLEIPPEILRRDDPWMLGFSLLLLPLMRSGLRINRLEGAVLLCGFLVYLGTLLSGAQVR